MYKKLLVVLLVAVSLGLLALADDPMDDEIKASSSETQTANPTEQPATTTAMDPKFGFKPTNYMCLIYCACGCREHHCCSGCKQCSQNEIKDLFFTNMNPNENTAMAPETTVAPQESP